MKTLMTINSQDFGLNGGKRHFIYSSIAFLMGVLIGLLFENYRAERARAEGIQDLEQFLNKFSLPYENDASNEEDSGLDEAESNPILNQSILSN